MKNRVMPIVLTLGLATLTGCATTGDSVTARDRREFQQILLEDNESLIVPRQDAYKYMCADGMPIQCSAGNRISMLCQCLGGSRQ